MAELTRPTPAETIAQTHRRLRRGMSFRVIFLLQDLNNATRALRSFEAQRNASLPCTEEYVSADAWVSYFRKQVASIRRRLTAARAEARAAKAGGHG